MGSAEKITEVSVQEYLDYLDSIEGRAEYYDGVIYDMAGSSVNHVRISGNFFGELYVRLRGSSCEPFSTDLKTEIQFDQKYSLPDLSVICGPVEYSSIRNDVVKNPTVIIEVLSESTISFDRGKKFEYYRMLPSLQEYVLVEQVEARVEVFARRPSGPWERTVYWGLEDVVVLNSIQVEIPMALIYANVKFEE